MLDFKRLIDTNFSIVDSVRVYLSMVGKMFSSVIKTAFISATFILLGQAVLSLVPNSTIVNICFWAWVGFVFSLSTASFFKTSEDIILNKTAQIYVNLAKVLGLSLKLFAVMALILGALTLLLIPAFYLTNPLFALPYKVLVSIFIIAAVPFVYFAPLAVALREANILNSFTFSYYMVLQRWSKISKNILTQVVFTALIAFWSYFIVSLLFFPNSDDFFSFIFTQATAIEEQARNLYLRFVFWEIMQVFVFTFVSGTFIGINTILFLYFDGSITKIIEEKNKIKVNRTRSRTNVDTKFVDVLAKSTPVNIDTKNEEEEIHHKTRREVLSEIYPSYNEEEYNVQNNKKTSSFDDGMTILEDNYPKQ